MKRSIEILGILFVFTFFCPFSGGEITSGNAYQAENGDNSYQWEGEAEEQPFDHSYNYSYEHCEVCICGEEQGNCNSYNNDEERAFNWKGEVEDQPLQYRYRYGCKNGVEAEDMQLGNSYNYAYVGPEEDAAGEMFNYAFSNQGAEQGPFELMNMASMGQAEDEFVGKSSVSISPQPLPEPGTVLLLGLGGLVLRKRRIA